MIYSCSKCGKRVAMLGGEDNPICRECLIPMKPEIEGEVHAEAIIPLDKLHSTMQQSSRNVKNRRHYIMLITECLSNSGYRAAYYSNEEPAVTSGKVLKTLQDLRIDASAYAVDVDKIVFHNGSSILFICAPAIGEFRVVAPVKWTTIDIPKPDLLWIKEADSIEAGVFERMYNQMRKPGV